MADYIADRSGDATSYFRKLRLSWDFSILLASSDFSEKWLVNASNQTQNIDEGVNPGFVSPDSFLPSCLTSGLVKACYYSLPCCLRFSIHESLTQKSRLLN